MTLPFPYTSPIFGLAPETREVTPARVLIDGAWSDWSGTCHVAREVTLDFGRLLTGRVWIQADGPMRYLYATDFEQLQNVEQREPTRDIKYGPHETYIHARPFGDVASGPGRGPVCIEDELSTVRLLKLKTDAAMTITRCWLEFSPPHLPLAGRFESTDADLDRLWHMGAYTTLLCTQQNTDSIDGIPAIGNGYVIWDGARRDREVWAGDLRLESLIWLSSYADPEPVRNSLYTLWQGRHIGCSDSGMIPGSGSSHQTFYEWVFWFLVNAWEYYFWTGDRAFLKSLLNHYTGLHHTLDWIRRKANDSGIVEATLSWMYTLKAEGELAALAIAQVAGLEALAMLLREGKQEERAETAFALARALRDIIPDKFYDPARGAMRMFALNDPRRAHFPLDANAWAIIYGIGDARARQGCLEFLDDPEMNVPAGLHNLSPPFDDQDGDWYHFPMTHWVHNDTVWPYPNCYAAMAYFEAGRTDHAFDCLKRFNNVLADQGHCTVWEGIMPDGSSPITAHGNLLSLCHGWGGAGTYLLPRYVLGIVPEKAAFEQIRIVPQLGSLTAVAGSLPTPRGPVTVELESTPDGMRGNVEVPTGMRVSAAPDGVSIVRRG